MKRKTNLTPILIMAAGGLLLALAAVWLLTGDGGSAVDAPTKVEDVPRVSIKDAYAAYLSGSAVFVDVRGSESYNAAHIPGAVDIPLAELASRIDELDKDDWILLYCT